MSATGSTTSAEKPSPWSSTAIDAASHGAIAFCQIYYEAYDEPNRRSTELPQLFLPSAKVIWNGNPVPADRPSLSAFLDAMPLSRHDLQTVDCHPVAGPPLFLLLTSVLDADASPTMQPALSVLTALDSSSAPDLIVNITGSVLHGPSVMSHVDTPNLPPQDHPRKFHEMFMLRVAEQTGEGMQPKYAIHSSNFRFMG
ncbi:hypothetical protein BD324DRAFT_162512 [Kockovaella imperatae]|uniref:NTF2 domain-containing protein n=1 Tax=Kockovaella imperatae TaxID=4999 RepID=A0A1Y1U7V8_9TREE|nr:hypothetical protein BD324DRAFT_162512 [Kockovaella imperatae]ORX34098.1 hypothetical protein BD324DRAFT_162512 [Kockovaella imperatae]